MNPQQAFENLTDAVGALEALGLRPFLTDGTLLGAVREGDFIGHDSDIDLGVFAEEYRPEARRAVERTGLRFYREHGSWSRGYEIRFVRHDIRVDLFLYYGTPPGPRFHAAWAKDGPIRYEYASFRLMRMPFKGRAFWAPEDPELHLRTKYGDDWRVPVTSWDWAWGPKNAQPWVEGRMV